MQKTLKGWHDEIKRLEDLGHKFDKAIKVIKDDGVNAFPVDVDLEDAILLTELCRSTLLAYSHGKFEFIND